MRDILITIWVVTGYFLVQKQALLGLLKIFGIHKGFVIEESRVCSYLIKKNTEKLALIPVFQQQNNRCEFTRLFCTEKYRF